MTTLDGYFYRCRVRNAFGQRFSNSAQLTVTVNPPACSTSCITTQVSGCAHNSYDCSPITYPNVLPGDICNFTVDSFIPCGGCGDPPSNVVVTGQVRLVCINLVMSRAYTATVFFTRIDLGFPTASFVWNFVASATGETTPYTNVPNPAATDDPGWEATGCSIVET